MASQTEWVAVDWGTSNVRAWGIAGDSSHTFAVSADKGMGRITKADYPAVLDELIGSQTDGGAHLDVVICGMAGARQGWIEAPYLDTPADLNQLAKGAVRPAAATRRPPPSGRCGSGLAPPLTPHRGVLAADADEVVSRAEPAR